MFRLKRKKSELWLKNVYNLNFDGERRKILMADVEIFKNFAENVKNQIFDGKNKHSESLAKNEHSKRVN